MAVDTKPKSDADQRAAAAAKLKKIEKLEDLNADAEAQAQVPVVDDAAPPVYLAQARDRQDEVNALTRHVIVCPGKVTPEIAIGERYLWGLHPKLKRGDTVILRHETLAWEVNTLVLRINAELQTVKLGVRSAHKFDISDKAVDLDNLTVEHKGPAQKWVVMLGTAKIKVGFDTEEEALTWIERKRLGV